MKLVKILKQILNESPDGIHDSSHNLKWYDAHTLTCIYDPHTKISFFAYDSGRIHNEIRNSIVAMYDMGENRTLTTSPDGVWSDETPSEDKDNEIMIQMFHANYSGKHLVNHFIQNTKIDEYKLVSRGRDLVKRGYIFYRAWTLGEDKIISFWNKSEEVTEDYDNILNHVYKFKNILPDEFKAEFADNFGEFVKDPSEVTGTESNSDDDVSDLLKKQHIDPKAKEKLKDLGINVPMKVADKPEWQKEFNEGLIKEDPDEVEYSNSIGDETSLLHSDSEAVPFMYDPKSKIGFVGQNETTHYCITLAMHEMLFQSKPRNTHGNWFWSDGYRIGLNYKNLSGEELLNYLYDKFDKYEFKSQTDNGSRKLIEVGYIFGRIWTKTGVVSFWNKRVDAMRHVDDLIDLMDFMLEDSSVSTEDLEWEFIDSLNPTLLNTDKTKDKPLSDEEYKTLLAKQHLDPKAKEELLKRGLIGAGRGREEPEWSKPFNENKSEIDNIKVSPSEKTKGHEYFQIKDVVTGGHADLDIRPHFNHDALEHDGFEMCVIEFYASPMEDRIFGKDNKRGGFGRNVFCKIFEICAERNISILSIFAPLKDSQDILKHYTEIGILTPIPYSKAVYGDFHTSFKIDKNKSMEYVNKNKKIKINEVTLYHGTALKNVDSIKKYGLLPDIGNFIKTYYDDSMDRYATELVYATDKKKIDNAIMAIRFAVGEELGKHLTQVTIKDVERYGAIAILKNADDTFRKYNEDDNNPPFVEPNDYYSEDSVTPDIILTGKKMVEFLTKIKNKYGNPTKKKIIPETSMKLTKILEELLVESKETYEVENVYLNGKRVGGITMAASEAQALNNIIIRNLPSTMKGSIGIKLIDAKKIGGYKIKKLPPRVDTPTTNRMPYRDD